LYRKIKAHCPVTLTKQVQAIIGLVGKYLKAVFKIPVFRCKIRGGLSINTRLFKSQNLIVLLLLIVYLHLCIINNNMRYEKVIRSFLLLVLILTTITLARAQNNYSNIQVDQLTDNQIRQLIQSGTSVGYSDTQLSQMFATQGMPPAEVAKLKLRIERIRKQDLNGPQNNGLQQSNQRGFNADTTGNPSSVQPSHYRNNNSNTVAQIFGEELFRNSKISFEPNLRMTTPKGYIVGPDDELLIDLSGNNEANYNLKVSPEGTIKLQYIGIINVSGLTIEQATAKIRRAMAKTYPGLLNGETSIAINLGNIRGIKVTIIGEIVKPGTYTLPSLATVFNALYASGGPNQNGSFRDIQLIRNNHVIATIDVYDFLLKGVQNNTRLQDQDIINIPVYQTRVEISGQVKRPALFEVAGKENLQDVLNFAGGFTSRAYTARIKVLQNTSRERRLIDINQENYPIYKPQNGDKYIVDSILNRFENRVEINGAVFRPGRFELEKGMTLKALIAKADGIREDAFLNNAYIYRLNADNTLTLIPFNVDKLLKGSVSDMLLQREDKITISSIFDLRDEYQVEIQGQVRNPGTFKYVDNMNLESVIQMAGGFKEGATPDRIEISRRVRNGDASSTTASTAQIFIVSINQNLQIIGAPFILQPFDVISVRNAEGYTVQKTVTIEGEVRYPGKYTIERKNEKISDLIKRAGGLTVMAFPEGASLRRPDLSSGNENTVTTGGQNKDDRLLTVQKIQQQAGLNDTTILSRDPSFIKNELVGIDLAKILRNPATRIDLLLEDGDVIKVPKQLQTVRISGEVLKPTNIIYEPGKDVLDYINGAGGFSFNAKRGSAYVEYANGSIKSTRHLLFFRNYPKLKPGA
jgi:protein involved in polysaccharide export with SLBB domain